MVTLAAALISAYISQTLSNWKVALVVFLTGYGAFVLLAWFRSSAIANEPSVILGGIGATPTRYQVERLLTALIVPPAVGLRNATGAHVGAGG